MVAVKLASIISGSIIFENVLSIRVLEWLVILVGCKVIGINELGKRIKKFICLIMLIIMQEVNIENSE